MTESNMKALSKIDLVVIYNLTKRYIESDKPASPETIALNTKVDKELSRRGAWL